jgi:hypothetical protein
MENLPDPLLLTYSPPANKSGWSGLSSPAVLTKRVSVTPFNAP